MTRCQDCGTVLSSGENACALCRGDWACRELHFAPLPIEDAHVQLREWPASLVHPTLITIQAGADGLCMRQYCPPGANEAAVKAWASLSRQQSRWQPAAHRLQTEPPLFALTTSALLPLPAAGGGDIFLNLGADLLSLAASKGQDITLILAIHGREDTLQQRLRALSAYATGTEKGVEDDSPNPWNLRLNVWRTLMLAGAIVAAGAGAFYAPGWLSPGPAGLMLIAGGLLGLTGFLGTQQWMQLRSLPPALVESRIQGTLLRVSIALAADDPGPLRLFAGLQTWRPLPRLWPDIRRSSFALPAADIAAMIAPLENGSGAGMLAEPFIQSLPAPPPTEILRKAPMKLGFSAATGDGIGISDTGHSLIVGGSRSGKSSAVFNLLRSRLEDVHSGPGLFLVDPHGSLADAFLHCIDQLPPAERQRAIQRLRVITPDPGAIVPLNLLTLDDFNWAGNALVQTGQRIWTDFWGPRMQAALLGLARLVHAWNIAHPEEAMGLMHTAFAAYNPEWRHDVRAAMPPAAQPGLDALDALLGQRAGDRRSSQWTTEVISPILSKLMALELSPWLHAALHQDRFVDLQDWIRQQHWIILRIPTGEIGREAGRLMAGMVYNIFEAAFRKVTAAGPLPFHFVIDEIQEIGGAMALENLLSEGGKFGASLFVLTQSLSLLRKTEGFGPLVQAMLSNTSAQLFFSPDPDDVETIREMLSLPARFGSTTMDIPSLHAWLRARLNGSWQPPTLLRVAPLVQANPARVRRIIEEVIHAHPDCYSIGENSTITHPELVQNTTKPVSPGDSSAQGDSRMLGW